ncbi:FecR family protein [Sphingobacterium spiritivorum]|uniref:Sigma factor regulatory protein, FecR/PupR family n=1 Tax=Sphingobacterium spiritivorum ATCC 33861 TaxID=525373 RepID=D7VNZ0_SPHSI|nr:FecR domain-containing protein [Sphingobacterium spiritivorum]EFK57637.1 sigma factor regulatory protein, FecR/PupR family [Sphingobacterium spiritivorum ATCC 33861]QQT36320.1 FecR domain-containing protein [Sphingobacterium spiritivorum]WQD33060.1 FecR domain-containing protein [Sphingobacterium spiritivorum]SUJ18618.1 fec operon regulator FecR [Sphingobacterium spiritivorum]
MNSKDQLITALFRKYLQGNVTETELNELLKYFGLVEHSTLLKELILNQLQTEIPASVSMDQIDLLTAKIDIGVLNHINSGYKSTLKRKIVWLTAAFLIMVGSFSYIVWKTSVTVPKGIEAAANILPGTNRAVVTFDNSKSINLSESQSVLINKHNTIGYENGESILVSDSVKWVSIATPRAGQYQVILEDGTRIWLNADSKVRYPSRFSGDERRIFVEGEVYLEVAHNQKRKKFVVETDRQIIQVLGTKFNVRTYHDAAFQATTLLEGAVNIESKKTNFVSRLYPGQQARTDMSGNNQIVKVDAEDYAAWTEELIVLNNLNLDEVIKELERWYDVNFDPVPAALGRKKVFGSLKRNLPLRDVLKALESSYDIHFTVNERRIGIKKRT